MHPRYQQGQLERVGKLDGGDDPGVGGAGKGGDRLGVDRRIGRHGAVGPGDKAREVIAGG